MALTPEQEWAETLFETFKYSYGEMGDDIVRLESLQDTYDNKVDKSLWPTQSQIPLPYAWAAVEEATGNGMDALFPPIPIVKVIPIDSDMDRGKMDDLQWALHLMVTHRMRVKREATRSVRDCFKLGIGYGMVEPVQVTPPAVFKFNVGGTETSRVEPGNPAMSLRYTYISPGKVVIYPSGVDFNGPDATPFTFVLRFFPEYQFKKMFNGRADGTAVDFKGKVDEIIAEARKKGFNSQTAMNVFVDKIAGRKTHTTGANNRNQYVPAMIPVLQCFTEYRHTWLYCGSERHILFDKKNTLDTMRNPMVKFDAWMDSDRWFPMNQAEADERITWGNNILFNAVNDLVTQNLKRPLLYNVDATDGSPPEFGPNGTLPMSGDVNKVAKFMEPPRIDQGIFNILNEMDVLHNRITGQRDFTDKNYTRGGAMAFQGLMESSGGRDRLRYMLLQTGGFESIYKQVMIYMQSLADMDLSFQRNAYNALEGRDYTEYFSITEEDLQHRFNVTLDFDEKNRNNPADIQMRLQEYGIMKDNPFFDQYEAAKYIIRDEYWRQRLILSRSEVEKKQQEQEQAKLEAMRSGSAGQGQNPGSEQTQGGIPPEQASPGMAGGQREQLATMMENANAQ